MKRPRLRPWAALRRVLFAPGFVLALWGMQLAAAKFAATPARVAAEAAIGRWTYLSDGHLLRAASELVSLNPSIGAVIGVTMVSSLLLATGFWIVAAPALLRRLDGERSWTWLLTACARNLPAMLVQSAYGLVFRGLCLALAALSIKLLGAPATPVAIFLALFPVLVLDRTRAAVILDDQRPFHPMTFLAAIAHVAKRPMWWLAGACAAGLKLSIAIAALCLVIAAGPSPMAIWVARAAGLGAVFMGMWRVSLAVEDLARANEGSTAPL